MRPVSPPCRFLRLATHPAALLALGLNILAPLSAAAQDTSRIARVTVYPGSATVARVAKVAAADGDVVQATEAWLAAAGAAPEAAAIRDWLHQRVPEYRAQPVRF